MTKGFFITGTDTDVGKTVVATALVRALVDAGFRTAVYKPVSAGCKRTANGLRNEDALLLAAQSNVDKPYELINPYAYEPPIAPHLAAMDVSDAMDIKHCRHCLDELADGADLVIAEGAGGWLVPLNDSQTMADLAVALALPVILVVGVRLGCINHSLLSVESIARSGLPLAGWIANRVDPDAAKSDENIDTIRERVDAPLLGIIPHDEALDSAAHARCIDLSKLSI